MHITRSFIGIFALFLTYGKLALGGDLHLSIKTELTLIIYEIRSKQTEEFCKKKKPHWMVTNKYFMYTEGQGKHNKCNAEKIIYLQHMNEHTI